MKTFNKISRAPLAWLGVLALLLVLAISFKFTVKAQDVASASPAVEWQDTDIGATVLAGSAQLDSDGGYIVSSTGGDISGTSDSFNYLYQTLNGNGEVITRILGVQGGNGLTKAGLMLRETLDAGARNAMISVKLSGEASFQWRSSVGGNTGRTLANAGMIVPGWLKIVRNGDWVGGYSSPDGINWTLTGWETIDGLATQVSVGLALNGGGVISRASFGQISLSQVNPADVLTPSVGAGDGLMGSYYSNRHLFGNPVMSRVDQGIDCDYQYLSSQGSNDVTYCTNDCLTALGMSKGDEYGVRWTGELQAQFNEPYTIYAGTDDGMRVWINENLVIDDWMGHSKRESSVTTNLVAGQKYLIRVEWFQNYGASKMSLSWSSPSTPKRIIPRDQLYSQPTDADGNGLPDRWERHYFGQIGANPGADVDGDGWSNSQKYSRHISPVNPMNWGVPNAWTHGDVDNRTHSDASDGSAAYSNGVFTVSSLGRDVWERVDDFHYVYQALGTNGEIVARISGLNGVNPEGMAGLMLRETQDKDSRNVFLAYGQDNILFFQSRTATGDNTVRNHSVTNQAAPGWLKLVRNNDWIGGYVSTNGTNWSLFDWEMIGGLPAQAYVGLAVTAHSHKGMRSPTTAQFDQVKLSPADPSEVLNPVEGNGDGLLASYRNDSLQYLPGLTNLVDEQIYFNWIHNPPVKILDPNSYGICWSGEVQAQFTEPYTFSLQCRQEDWVRVWINEELIIDGWRTLHPDTIFKGTVNLMAGQHYLIRVEMFNNHGRGMARLKWESPSTPKHIVPQSQLYSQPTDSDGNGLPDLWELHYFGHIGVDPNADPDGDGLSNIQEYRYHTNPTKADTDNDGMPDGWEVSHGLDPQFNDAGADYDNSGWSNLQKYAAGLDPYNLDANGDGLPDAFEAQYLGLDVSTSHANLTSVAAVANGAQATNFLGRWQVDGNDIFALDRRGGLDFNLPVKNADKYVLNLIGTQNQFNPLETSFKLLLAIDGQTLGHYTLNAGYGTNGEVALVLPYLKAGPHTLRVFWDGVADHSSLRIKQVKLLAVSGADSNHNGIKDWVENMVSLEAGLDQTNKTIGSYTSPICLEGRDAYPTLASLTNTPAATLSPVATTDGRWYVNVPLQTSQTVFSVSYQNGALTETRKLQWLPINLLASPADITIRQGDSLLLTALPTNGVNGNLQITIGANSYTGKAAKGIPCKFDAPGTYLVTGAYTSGSGSPLNGSFKVKVVPAGLPTGEPAAWTWNERYLNLTNLAAEVVLQADSRLTCIITGTNAGVVQLMLGTQDNEERSIIARLGTNGPVLNSLRISGFDEWSGDQASLNIIQTYSDGSQLVEMTMICSPVEPDVTFVLEPIVSGIMFDDGTTTKTLTAANFDALGQCLVRFIRPAVVRTSVCHSIKAYQGGYQIGYRH